MGICFLIQNFKLDISKDVCDKFKKIISLIKRDQVILQLFNSSAFKPLLKLYLLVNCFRTDQ